MNRKTAKAIRSVLKKDSFDELEYVVKNKCRSSPLHPGTLQLNSGCFRKVYQILKKFY